MSELKKYTRLGSNSRQLAALLQAKAPKGHMLAYINPQEAALLKAHGGSGHEHADTGIPSFEDEEAISGYAQQYPDLYPGGQTQGGSSVFYPSGESKFSFSPAEDVVSFPSVVGAGTPAPAPAAFDTGGGFQNRGIPTDIPQFGRTDISAEGISPTFQPAPFRASAAEEPGLADRAAKATGLSKDTLGRLGLAGTLGLLGQRTARAAGAQGQAGRAEMQQIASPYQTAGAQMQAAAQRGELLPVGQQSLQAAQAQMAQDIQRRGGVGAQQAQQQMVNLRQQLLQQQYDYGLKLSGIGDNIALGAIKTGLQADQYVNQLTNSFYSNMAYIASGMSPGVRIGGRE